MATINGTNFNDNNTVNGNGLFHPTLVGRVDPGFMIINGLLVFTNDLPDTINGFDGNDIINALGTNDTLNGGNGNDTLNGNAGNDIINAGAGNDFLNGGTGLDVMSGGIGNDSYYVDSVTDTITEFTNQGTDIVFSSVSTDIQWLPSNVENLTLLGTATYGDGNGLNNLIRGTNNINYLYGHDGNDTLQGAGGNDVLIGGNGNDTLDGGFGSDSMFGGAGHDNYIVDKLDYYHPGDNTLDMDIVTETSGQGTDTVIIANSVNEYGPYDLPANVENLKLDGMLVWARGNNLNNFITNNNANTIAIQLDGLDGNDTLLGNKQYDALYGGNGNDTLVALGGVDHLYGGFGNDILDGGTGVDILRGGDFEAAGAGADKFILGYRGSTNEDFIADFNHDDDTILLVNSLDVGMVGAINPGINGLTFSGGNFAGNTLNPAWYFEGLGRTGNNNSSQLSGIYVNTTNGDIWYNPTNNSINATDSEIIGHVNVSVAASLNYTDFVYGG